MLATVERNMQAITSTPATRGTRTTASAPAVATQSQQVAGTSSAVRRSGLSRGASRAPASAPAEVQATTRPPPTPDRPLSEKTDRAVKLIAPKPKFIPRPKTSSTVRR